jgi:plasmid stabilization system protein ParE
MSSTLTPPTPGRSFQQREEYLIRLQTLPDLENIVEQIMEEKKSGRSHKAVESIDSEFDSDGEVPDIPRPPRLPDRRGSDNGWEIRDFQFIRQLGSGAYATVYQVKHKPTGGHFALKTLNKKKILQLREEQHVNNERLVLACLPSQQNIVKL